MLSKQSFLGVVKRLKPIKVINYLNRHVDCQVYIFVWDQIMNTIEYYFDFTCPYAFAGSHRLLRLAKNTSRTIVWKPVLLGGLLKHFQTSQNLLESVSDAKRDYLKKDIVRTALMEGLNVVIPKAHPVKSVRALRTLLALPEGSWTAFIESVFKAYWIGGTDISSEVVIANVLSTLDLSEDQIITAKEANCNPAIKEELRNRTDAAIKRDVFGVPTFFSSLKPGEAVQQFWGQDRIEFLETQSPTGKSVNSESKCFEFFFDFSSPYAYLASTQIEEIEESTGAECIWTPMLLGALFKSLGTADVPLFKMAPEKQDYLKKDLDDWAAYFDVPFSFPKAFPLRSVLPLRWVLANPKRQNQLIKRLMHAYWVEHKDISNAQTLKSIGQEFDLSSDIETMAQHSKVKERLRANTERALAKGVFGTPTFLVSSHNEENMYWGQDRISQLKRALAS